jgi:hypothetical protein
MTMRLTAQRRTLRGWRRSLSIAGLGFLLISGSGIAPAITLPGEPVSIQAQSSQVRAEKAFEAGNYDRAHWHYLKVLAPAGDKYAHYMLGHLSEHGLGVPRDRSRALAWYRLAAERDYEILEGAYERLAQELTPGEQARAESIYESISERYGDRTLLTRALKRNEANLRRMTGTRTGFQNRMYVVLPLEMGRTVNGETYYGELKNRIEMQTELLRGNVELGDMELIDLPEPETTDG